MIRRYAIVLPKRRIFGVHIELRRSGTPTGPLTEALAVSEGRGNSPPSAVSETVTAKLVSAAGHTVRTALVEPFSRRNE
jgi:hypothetical protein